MGIEIHYVEGHNRITACGVNESQGVYATGSRYLFGLAVIDERQERKGVPYPCKGCHKAMKVTYL